MKRVTDKEFYEKIGPLDVTLSVLGNHPYKTEFRLRRERILVGYQDTDGQYYLND